MGLFKVFCSLVMFSKNSVELEEDLLIGPDNSNSNLMNFIKTQDIFFLAGK